MSIVDTPEKDLSNVDRKYDMRKVRTSSVNSSSTFFSTIRAMYNIVNCDQKQRLVLKSYITGINPLIYPKRHYDNIFTEKLVNELHDWIDKLPHVIQPPNVSDSLFVKINVTLVKEQKQLLQISVL